MIFNNGRRVRELEREIDRLNSRLSAEIRGADALQEALRLERLNSKYWRDILASMKTTRTEEGAPKPLPPVLDAAGHRAEAQKIVHAAFNRWTIDATERDRLLAKAGRHLHAADLLDRATKKTCLFPNDPSPCDCNEES